MNKRKTKTSAAVKNRYNEKAYDRIALVVPKGSKDKIKEHAEQRGESLNGFVNRAITETMQRDSSGAGSKTEPAAAQDQTEGSAAEAFESLLDF